MYPKNKKSVSRASVDTLYLQLCRGVAPGGALEGKGPQRRPQRRLDRRLLIDEAGTCCGLGIGWAPCRGGRGTSPPSTASLSPPPPPWGIASGGRRSGLPGCPCPPTARCLCAADVLDFMKYGGFAYFDKHGKPVGLLRCGAVLSSWSPKADSRAGPAAAARP